MSIFGDDFDAAVGRLQKAAGDFTMVFNQFVSIPPEFRTDNWTTVYNRAVTVRGTIQMFTGAIDSAYQWARGAFGLDGMAGLGLVVPAVPWLTVAAMGAAISAIMVTYGYMTEELNKSAQKQRLFEINVERAENGMPALSADEYLISESGMFGDVGNAVKWLAIGGFVVFFLPKILENLGNKK